MHDVVVSRDGRWVVTGGGDNFAESSESVSWDGDREKT